MVFFQLLGASQERLFGRGELRKDRLRLIKRLKEQNKTGIRSGSGGESINTYSTVHFVPDMVLSTGDTSPCPHVACVRVMHLMGDRVI